MQERTLMSSKLWLRLCTISRRFSLSLAYTSWLSTKLRAEESDCFLEGMLLFIWSPRFDASCKLRRLVLYPERCISLALFCLMPLSKQLLRELIIFENN